MVTVLIDDITLNKTKERPNSDIIQYYTRIELATFGHF